MIVVTGATGKLGSAVVEHLTKLVRPADVVASVKDPSSAGALSARGVVVRCGDYDRPDILVSAFVGADRLLLISSSGIDEETRVRRHRNAIDAASRARVGHVYYTSLVHAPDSAAFVMKAHVTTERLLADSGLPFTVLRNGVYAEATKTYLGDYRTGEVLLPADGPVAWVSRGDLAEGTARLLRDGQHPSETLQLTGGEALTLSEYTAILAEATGRPIRVRTVTLEEYVSHQVRGGRPEEEARQWATTYFAIARGEFAAVDPFLGETLGRAPQTVEAVLNQATSRGNANG